MSGGHTCPIQTGAQDNQQSRQLSRTIPINIQTLDTLENGEDLKDTDQVKGVKIRNIPIEIISCEAEPPMTKEQQNPGPSSARTIPIQRISKNNVRTTPSMARTPSRESLGSSTNKIKMGTSAIRIPIQVIKFRLQVCILRIMSRFREAPTTGRRSTEQPSLLIAPGQFPYSDRVCRILVLDNQYRGKNLQVYKMRCQKVLFKRGYVGNKYILK